MNTNTLEVVSSAVQPISQKIGDILGVLAEKVGVGVDHFWPIFVKQQSLEGWMFCLFSFVCMLVGCIFTYIGFRKGNKYEWEEDKGLSFVPALVFGLGVMFLTGMAFCIGGGTESITQVLNPEYFALKNVISMVR